MRQISKHDVNKLTAREVKDRLPFQVVSDGEVIAVVLPTYDVNKANGLRFSKARQVGGRLA